MEIKPESVKKVAYPALAVVAAAAFSSCDREGGEFPQPTGGIQPVQMPAPEGEPQPLGGDVPKIITDTPTPPEDTDQGIPGEPPIDSSRIQPEE